jgi:hypothetical protein
MAALGLGALIFVQRRSIGANREEISTVRAQIEEDRNLLKKTPDLVKRVIIQRETDATIREILSAEEDLNEFVRTLHKFAEESGVTISTYKEQKVTRSAKAKKNEKDFEKVGYTLSLDADVFQLLAFFDLIESHRRLMSITSFKLQAARRQAYDQADGAPRHRVTVDIETYVYAPKDRAQEAKIDGYERKRDLLVSEIAQRSSLLRVPNYDFRGPTGRRDPFVDPRVPVTQNGAPVLTIEQQLSIVDRLVVLADEAQAAWERTAATDNLIAEMKARAELEDKLALLEEEVRKVQADGQLIFIPAQRRFDIDVVAVLEGLHAKMTSSEEGRGPSIAALQEANETILRHLRAMEYELALDAFQAMEPKLVAAQKDPVKLPLVQAMQELAHKAQTVLEFEAIPLVISGVALYEDRRPVALINGDAIGEGELVGEDLLVRNISKDRIEFAYHGLVLARRLDDEGAGPLTADRKHSRGSKQ